MTNFKEVLSTTTKTQQLLKDFTIDPPKSMERYDLSPYDYHVVVSCCKDLIRQGYSDTFNSKVLNVFKDYTIENRGVNFRIKLGV